GDKVLSMQLALPPARYASPQALISFAEQLRPRLVALVDARAAAAVSLLPLSGLLSAMDYRAAGRPEPPPEEVPPAHYRIATPGYFRLMGIALAGREFTDDDREKTARVVIVSRTLAQRHWPGASAVGEHLTIEGQVLEIVGVCADVKQFGLDARP